MSLPPSSKKIKLNGSLLENPREITAVITHASCPDGTGCIFVLFYYFKTMGIDLSNVFFTSLNHSDVKTKSNKLQSVESNLKGKNLVICDFNFPKAYYEEIKSLCNKVITVDHHEDAVPELEDDVTFYFDVEECGTTLLWKWLRDKDKEFRSKTPEMLLILKYIRDRDLWKWEMPYSKAVNSYMYFKSNVESLLEDFYEKSDEEASKIIAAYSDQGDIMISLIKWITDQSSNFGKKKTFLGKKGG
jgi:oligoribonuclease NrnB/cAMP/cGMP phosphodiesterase (DHH superfamily)